MGGDGPTNRPLFRLGEHIRRLRTHLNKLKQAKQMFLWEQGILGHFTDLQSCFPIILPFSGRQSLPFIYRTHLICYILGENATASPLCTRAEDQSSWAGNPSTNYAANCRTGCPFIHHHSANISSSGGWWSWSSSRALWGRLVRPIPVTHSRCLYLFVIFLALFSLSN